MDLKKHHKPTFDNISKEKRDRIINVATKEFALKGFENANINDIAKKAEISVGSLYKYFDNKQDLFLTIVNHNIATMDNLLTALSQSDEDILLKVEQILRTIQKYSKENELIIKFYNVMTNENNPRFAGYFANEMESLTARIYYMAKRREMSEPTSIRRLPHIFSTICLCLFSFRMPATIIRNALRYMPATVSLKRTILLSSSA